MEEMETWEVVNGLLARGLKINVVNGILKVGPRDLISEETAAVIRKYTPALLAFMVSAGDDEVQWRVAAMLEQLLPLSWPCPIPTLHAKPDSEPKKEDCGSCGELLDVGEGNSYCCGACARAKDVALSLWLQRPAASAKVA